MGTRSGVPGCGKGHIIPNCRTMNLRILLIAFLLTALAAEAQNTEGGLAKIKEQELEEVRERISELKRSMRIAELDATDSDDKVTNTESSYKLQPIA